MIYVGFSKNSPAVQRETELLSCLAENNRWLHHFGCNATMVTQYANNTLSAQLEIHVIGNI